MPADDLLPMACVEILRSTPAAAMGALMVIAEAHRDLLLWALRTLAVPTVARPTGAPCDRKPRHVRRNGRGSRRDRRDHDDQRLLEALRSAPAASISDLAASIRKSRSSTVSALHRLRDAGLAESVDRRWRSIETAPHEPVPKWVEPLTGARRAHVHAG